MHDNVVVSSDPTPAGVKALAGGVDRIKMEGARIGGRFMEGNIKGLAGGAREGAWLEAYANMTVHMPKGSHVEVTLVRGNVEATQIEGSITVDTWGDVTVHDVRRPLNVQAATSDVTLYVPDDTGAVVDLQARAGSIDVIVPLSGSTRERGRVHGTLGDGRGRIQVTTSEGSIRLLPN